ncbi:GtrA family protein [Oscillospiraceae bacterium MB08-C2-2]|nr:GtrA family protein [Oscillospiraceae bacterium MB08-C2-2]
MDKIIKLVKSDEFAKLVKFGITGVVNTLVDFLVFTLLRNVVGWDLTLSQVISYSAGVVNSYILNRSWTFRSREKFLSPQLVKFLVLSLSMLGLSVVLINLFTLQFGLVEMAAKGITIVLVLIVNFLINRLWVFR